MYFWTAQEVFHEKLCIIQSNHVLRCKDVCWSIWRIYRSKDLLRNNYISYIPYCKQTYHHVRHLPMRPIQTKPKVSHIIIVKQILRYLWGTKSFGLCYLIGNDFSLQAFTDSDHVGCKLDHKSKSRGYQFFRERL